MTNHRNRSRAFTLPESIIATTVAAALLCLLLVRAPHSRHLSAQSESLANLRQLAAITGNYQADHEDRMWGLSWTPTQHPTSQYPDINANANFGPLEAASAQAIDIIRRRVYPQMQIPTSWIPYLLYSHLPLADYVNSDLPLSYVISPEDRNRRRWAADFNAFRNFQLQPQPDVSNPINLRWAFSSSYELAPHFWSPDALTTTTGAVVQGGLYNQFQLLSPSNGPATSSQLGPRPLTQVQFPANKVLLYDTAQWTGARTPVFFMYDHARLPIVMVDGSAAVRVQSTANLGFRPDSPNTLNTNTVVTYDPGQSGNTWDPAVIGNVTSLRARYRFTRWGLRGRDFDGQEVTAP